MAWPAPYFGYGFDILPPQGQADTSPWWNQPTAQGGRPVYTPGPDMGGDIPPPPAQDTGTMYPPGQSPYEQWQARYGAAWGRRYGQPLTPKANTPGEPDFTQWGLPADINVRRWAAGLPPLDPSTLGPPTMVTTPAPTTPKPDVATTPPYVPPTLPQPAPDGNYTGPQRGAGGDQPWMTQTAPWMGAQQQQKPAAGEWAIGGSWVTPVQQQGLSAINAQQPQAWGFSKGVGGGGGRKANPLGGGTPSVQRSGGAQAQGLTPMQALTGYQQPSQLGQQLGDLYGG